MKITHVRAANCLLAFVFIISGHLVYGWYLAAMHVSLEVLNRQRLYLQHSPGLYNSIFVLYELVLAERLRHFFFSETAEWLINFTEHLLFGIIICTKVYIYTSIFGNRKNLSRWKRGIIAFVIFNLAGVFNEIFQNNLARRKLYVFIPDSVKDIQVNLAGALIFAVAVYYRMCLINRKNKMAL